VKTLERIQGTKVRQWKTLTDGLSPGKGYLVENHGQPEAVILHPADALAERFDLEAHFNQVRQSRPLQPAEIHRAPEL
jgi:hypothetical protein